MQLSIGGAGGSGATAGAASRSRTSATSRPERPVRTGRPGRAISRTAFGRNRSAATAATAAGAWRAGLSSSVSGSVSIGGSGESGRERGRGHGRLRRPGEPDLRRHDRHERRASRWRPRAIDRRRRRKRRVQRRCVGLGRSSVNFSLGGSGGSASAGSTVGVTNFGDISTAGANSFGILAQSLGGGGGNGGFSVAGLAQRRSEPRGIDRRLRRIGRRPAAA